ncbi:MAG: hypothetical protein EOM10_15750, partial [Opitutae bacterium]|nr:hypothetical protein [Opitutae bacterium]
MCGRRYPRSGRTRVRCRYRPGTGARCLCRTPADAEGHGSMTAAVISASLDVAPPVFGLLGDGRVHLSRRAAMYARILARVGLGGTCVPLRVAAEDLGTAVASLKILHLAGADVGAPYRQKAAACLDVLSEGANIVGAVNTIVRRDNILKGYNTDAIGIMDTLEALDFAVDGCRAIVFGTGGAARAAVFILIWLRAEQVWIAGRNPVSAGRLAEALEKTAPPLQNKKDEDFHLSAKPIGSALWRKFKTFLARMFLLARSYPECRHLIWFTGLDRWESGPYLYGIWRTENGVRPLPAVAAYAQAAHEIDHAEAGLLLDSDIKLLRIRKAGHTSYAVWNAGDEREPLPLAGLPSDAAPRSIYGTPLKPENAAVTGAP